MSETRTLVCDGCGGPITCTAYEREYFLELRDVAMPRCGGAVYAMTQWPNLDGTKHFCRKGCLVAWLDSTKECGAGG